ncbi:unnamed protein product [Allacma fusca]|uniref:Beta-ketoacyl synthase-like N-terminal domain-containing protein n=1 Tax=Allacma fusca TaxID=39272 RepID=A0A8J2KBR3_9HEXA|nr:unnamed protein product [Allacma fusca]
MENREDWVISGLSGRFPDSENSEIFWQHLIQGKDMVSDNPRWDAETFETPRRAGKIPLIEKFDASFFGVSGTQANKMDPKISMKNSFDLYM